jgi:hypothetical protein
LRSIGHDTRPLNFRLAEVEWLAAVEMEREIELGRTRFTRRFQTPLPPPWSSPLI